MSVTIKELAQRANVSIATISRALNNDIKVKGETKEMIVSLAKEFNYKPHVLARNFVKKKTNTIGLVLPDVVDEFFTEVIRGVDLVAYSGGYNVMIAGTHSERTMAESIINFMGRGVVDGVIVMAPALNDVIKEVLSKSHIPVVILNSKSDAFKYDSVGVDNLQGAYSMMDYLINTLCHRKIAHISGPAGNNDAHLRKKAYLKALQDNNIAFKEEWLINGDFTVKGGETACRRLLSLLEKPEVIFASNDMMAIGCYRAIQSFGLKIPDDIGVVGFDDIFVSQFLTPRLTTVLVPIIELGKTAATLLLKRIDNNNSEQEKHIKISTGLVIGKSCKQLI
ncbi:MAG: LacI family DNA-binding transcriptional regulator [Ignavibacteriales bacterium]|nr:LacI family DNA-binding transcriptional regulator [Ignavibacteriales bacterium]